MPDAITWQKNVDYGCNSMILDQDLFGFDTSKKKYPNVKIPYKENPAMLPAMFNTPVRTPMNVVKMPNIDAIANALAIAICAGFSLISLVYHEIRLTANNSTPKKRATRSISCPEVIPKNDSIEAGSSRAKRPKTKATSA